LFIWLALAWASTETTDVQKVVTTNDSAESQPCHNLANATVGVKPDTHAKLARYLIKNCQNWKATLMPFVGNPQSKKPHQAS
jgi:hypothetical protein